MKNTIKTLVCVALLTVLWCTPCCVSAQGILVTLKDHSSVNVTLDNSFCLSFLGDDVVFHNAKGRTAIPRNSIASITLEGKYGDVNRDGAIDMADIATIIVLMQGKDINDGPRQEIMAVDLALPSGRQWASMNVGAVKENAPGLYFAWGDTVGYTDSADDGYVFDWANYKWMAEGGASWEYISKYQCPTANHDCTWYAGGQFIGDGLDTLLPADDAATSAWGSDWRMPTAQEAKELILNTQHEWTQMEGVWGCKFTGKNGNYIFLPAAGERDGEIVCYVDETTEQPYGLYWTKEVYQTQSWYATAYSVRLDEGGTTATAEIEFPLRNRGLNIRPVWAK